MIMFVLCFFLISKNIRKPTKHCFGHFRVLRNKDVMGIRHYHQYYIFELVQELVPLYPMYLKMLT